MKMNEEQQAAVNNLSEEQCEIFYVLMKTTFLSVLENDAHYPIIIPIDEALAIAETCYRDLTPGFIEQLGRWSMQNPRRAKKDIPRFIRYTALCRRHNQTPCSFVVSQRVDPMTADEIEKIESQDYDAIRIGERLAEVCGGDNKVTIAVLIGAVVAAMCSDKMAFSFDGFDVFLRYSVDVLSNGGSYMDIAHKIEKDANRWFE